MITFHTIKYKNFLSYGNYFTEVQLDSVKRSIITAKNGSGKSSMFDAIVFALFGKPYRKINKPNLVNSINGKGLLTEIEFTVNDHGKKRYKVRRGIKPSIFEIYINGIKMDEMDSIRDQQKFLEEQILQTNFRTFTQIVILGAGTYIPFMHLTSAQRREFIENLLDIDIFSTMNVLLKGRYSILKELETMTTTKLQLIKEKIVMQNQLIKKLESQQNEERQNIENEIKELEKQKKDEEKARDGLQKAMDKIQKKLTTGPQKLKNLRDGLQEKSLSIKSQVVTVQKEKHFIERNTSCPTCKQDIPDDHRDKMIERYDSELHENKKHLKTVNQEFEEIVEKMKNIESLQKEYFEKQTEHRTSEATVQKLIQEIANKKQRATIVKDEDIEKELGTLDTFESQKEELKDREKTLKEKRDLFDTAYDLLKDNGIKSRIISQYIPILNKLINQYLSQMNFQVAFTLDDTFSEKILSRYRDEFTYDNFSNGEKMRIDIALLMVWRNLAEMKNSIHTNLLLMDEVFDSSLDEDGVDDFLKILETVTKTNNIFIISHKPGFDEKFDQVINVEKQNDFSYLDIKT